MAAPSTARRDWKEAERMRELFAFLFVLEQMGKGGRNKDEQSVFIMETTSHCSPREPCKIDPLSNWGITWGLEVCECSDNSR